MKGTKALNRTEPDGEECEVPRCPRCEGDEPHGIGCAKRWWPRDSTQAERHEDLGAVCDLLVSRIAKRWGRVELLPLRRETKRILGCAKAGALGESVERLAESGTLVEDGAGGWVDQSDGESDGGSLEGDLMRFIDTALEKIADHAPESDWRAGVEMAIRDLGHVLRRHGIVREGGTE
jgi:hypothetical protein